MARRIIETVVNYKPQPPYKTAEQMEQICCEPTDKLQCGEKSDGTWHGLTAQELLEKYRPGLDALGRDSKGRYVVIELAPRKNPCGEKLIEYDTSGGKCCEEVVDMSWDEDNSIDIIPSESSGQVTVLGGRGPYNWLLRSRNSFFDSALTKQKITTSSPVATIYSAPTCCGMIAVEVSDGCSKLIREIRAEDGEWTVKRSYSTGQSQEILDAACALDGLELSTGDVTSPSNTRTAVLIDGRYQQTEVVARYMYENFEGECINVPLAPGEPAQCISTETQEAAGGCDNALRDFFCRDYGTPESTCMLWSLPVHLQETGSEDNGWRCPGQLDVQSTTWSATSAGWCSPATGNPIGYAYSYYRIMSYVTNSLTLREWGCA